MATALYRMLDPGRRNDRIAGLWWAMALRGVGAIVLGTLAALWPDITLLVLAGIFAVYCAVDAVFSIILAVRGARRNERWGWSALHGVVALATAVLAVFYPGLTILAFVVLLTAWALLSGVASIVGAFRLKGDHGRGWMIAAGGISLALGVLLLLFPQIGIFTLSWMIAFQGWLAGSILLSVAYKLRLRDAERVARGDHRPHEPVSP
ncbi:HdeD family acid-resistance protein [Sphingomonas japonica]|uniref:Uncharacterized membrane protein HdeD (DUF308 family) n=1 Tax=Sphingomonas japonica TaxID=511662 RepID=A0ABX0TYL5_9SPHN|nr:HdeD family acid-resistance protein [Sphingomonas japonica]NIJ23416.1 uncharacterized membrane protein HdeD (DUF308 family) [Sphingomonas japonica]